MSNKSKFIAHKIMKKWNWQLHDWPKFSYDPKKLEEIETKFSYSSGSHYGVYSHLDKNDQKALRVEIISDESLKTSEIEGEILNRDSLQSSIGRNFGLTKDHHKIPPAESGIAEMMTDLYHNFSDKLTHETMFKWHEMLTRGRRDLRDVGKYRTHKEPMRIVSSNVYESKIHFEAPPSKLVKQEMRRFVKWFNDSGKNGKNPLPALTRAVIAHLYFITIHPFEDGNGRIARALVIKSLSQSLEQPLLTSLSTIIQSKKKKYYDALAATNTSNAIDDWLSYFSQTILESQNHTQKVIEFTLVKTKLYTRLQNQLNERQQKVLDRMFREGLGGFKGGLSAENYIAITKTSQPTATRDLHDLVEKKALIRKGEFKGTRYSLNLEI